MAAFDMSLGSRPVLQSVGAIIAVATIAFLIKLYRVRQMFRTLQKQGLVSLKFPMPPGTSFTNQERNLKPMPPHHPIFGHIILSAKIIQGFPSYAHGNYLPNQIRRLYPHLDTAFYLDTWPFGPPVLAVISPDMMYQFTQDRYLPKDAGMRHFLKPLTGKYDLVTLEGPIWKRWRAIFNPGFSASHIMTLIPGMVEEVSVFRDILRGHAEKGDLFCLENLALNLTIDIIGRVVMDHKFNSQLTYNDMTSALREQLRWCTYGIEMNPLEYFNVFRPFVHWYNTWRMDRYLARELDNRYDNIQGKAKSKSIIDLALNSYLAEKEADGKTNGKPNTIDTTFRDFAMSQVKLFIFAGHDTTSAGATFVIHLLSKNPSVLVRLREEHDSVFGLDLAATASLLSSKPQLLNQLPYTLAVIKEALRFYPAVSAPRAGQPDFFVSDSDGRQFPTEHCLVWGNHYGVHHNPRFWARVEEFLPERWLVPEGDPLYPHKNAWRPFERGPRNCIGQELALVEIKVILALTIREFDIVDAYEEWDERKGNPKGLNVNGERAYMIIRGGGHPADFYPCKVSFAEGGKAKAVSG
ncbi:hypothetical protein MMC30_002433 [Trapelia coarctata]|nr:hypothetical protein [Trapelia coarctata]